MCYRLPFFIDFSSFKIIRLTQMIEEMSKNLDQVILQLYARTPAPCRDYCGLTITNEVVILNVWNITYGPHVYPKRFKCALENLKENKFVQTEIGRVFGYHVVDYAKSLSMKELKLENFPTKAFLSILKFVAAKDILSLSQTSKILFERCNDDKVWSLLFRKLFKRRITRHDLLSAEEVGWKQLILDKLTFMPHKQSMKKKNFDSKSVSNLYVQTSVYQNVSKTTTNLIPDKTLNSKYSKSATYSNVLNANATLKTLSQVKNDLRLNSSPKNIVQLMPKNKNTVTPNTLTATKTVEKPHANTLHKKPAVVKKQDVKMTERKTEVKPLEKKVLRKTVVNKTTKLNL